MQYAGEKATVKLSVVAAHSRAQTQKRQNCVQYKVVSCPFVIFNILNIAFFYVPTKKYAFFLRFTHYFLSSLGSIDIISGNKIEIIL